MNPFQLLTIQVITKIESLNYQGPYEVARVKKNALRDFKGQKSITESLSGKRSILSFVTLDKSRKKFSQ